MSDLKHRVIALEKRVDELATRSAALELQLARLREALASTQLGEQGEWTRSGSVLVYDMAPDDDAIPF